MDKIRVRRQFRKSVRIDTDVNDNAALDGFICLESSGDVLRKMAVAQEEKGQGAFTWTGPYGSGKSSLAVVLHCLLSGTEKKRARAAKIVGESTAQEVWRAMPCKRAGWSILPVVGRREDPVKVIGDAFDQCSFGSNSGRPKGGWTGSALLEALVTVAKRKSKGGGGLVLFLDEMGQYLEGAAHEGRNIHIFQEFAELASRSNGTFLVIGILHQKFGDYAGNLPHAKQEEWLKVQGRYADYSVNPAGEEQLYLLSRAIESPGSPKNPREESLLIGELIARARQSDPRNISALLDQCWPLHPVVAGLLGPISRRSFGQNQRSIFSFLTSRETAGFHDFLTHAKEDAYYLPHDLWDYLSVNLEGAILNSPDGHRWATALESFERAHRQGADDLHLQLLKTIALIDIFKERSGLRANDDTLASVLKDGDKRKAGEVLENLKKWSAVRYDKSHGAYVLYAGSDFNVEEALKQELASITRVDFTLLNEQVSRPAILAARHHYETGVLRWFDVAISSLENLKEAVDQFEPMPGTMGQFLLAIATQNETEEEAAALAEEVIDSPSRTGLVSVVGIAQGSSLLLDRALEIMALESVKRNNPQISGDWVARRQIVNMIASASDMLGEELQASFDSAQWYTKKLKSTTVLKGEELSQLASNLADEVFLLSPRINNELLSRHKLSTSVARAQKLLVKAMVSCSDQPRLGIEEYPAEGGLYDSVLGATKLHQEKDGVFKFVRPGKEDPFRLAPLWEVADAHLVDNKERSVQLLELYDLWRSPKFGVPEGMLPVLFGAYFLSNQNKIAFYKEGVFSVAVSDLEVDVLLKVPQDIQIRWMELTPNSNRLLLELAAVVHKLNPKTAIKDLSPLLVAQGLVEVYDGLPAWTDRTMELSLVAIQVRQVLKKAHDPNELIFNHLPDIFGVDLDLPGAEEAIALPLGQALEELRNSYPGMLEKLRSRLLEELQVPSIEPLALQALRERAENIRDMGGDLNLTAFVQSIQDFQALDKDMERIVGLVINRPADHWTDRDVEQAEISIAEVAQKFLRLEAFAHVKGRPDKRSSMAVVLGFGSHARTKKQHFDVSKTEEEDVDKLVAGVEAVLDKSDAKRTNIILGAFAKLISKYLDKDADGKGAETVKKKVG